MNVNERNADLINHIKIHCNRIMEAVEKIETYENFETNYIYQNSLFFDFIQIGENINNLSDDFKETNKSIPFRKIVDFRNLVVHGYGTVRLKEVWKCAIKDVPELCENIKNIK